LYTKLTLFTRFIAQVFSARVMSRYTSVAIIYTIILVGKWWYGLGFLEICSWFFNGYYLNCFV